MFYPDNFAAGFVYSGVLFELALNLVFSTAGLSEFFEANLSPNSAQNFVHTLSFAGALFIGFESQLFRGRHKRRNLRDASAELDSRLKDLADSQP